jgi:hypothetical protein
MQLFFQVPTKPNLILELDSLDTSKVEQQNLTGHVYTEGNYTCS